MVCVGCSAVGFPFFQHKQKKKKLQRKKRGPKKSGAKTEKKKNFSSLHLVTAKKNRPAFSLSLFFASTQTRAFSLEHPARTKEKVRARTFIIF
jgi:hypothetical protein